MTSVHTDASAGAKVFEGPRTLLPQPCLLVIFGGTGRPVAGASCCPPSTTSTSTACCPRTSPSSASACRPRAPATAIPTSTSATAPRAASTRFSRQPLDESHWADFARALFFVQGSFNDARAYEQLKARLDALDQQFGIPGSRVYYLAVPPQLVEPCASSTSRRPAWSATRTTRRPSRASSSRSRSAAISRAPARSTAPSAAAFAESQTYRIDHYLGKETVQNLLVLRFANSIFEPLWNQKYIDHVQITVAEEEGLAQYDPKTGEMHRHAGSATTKASAPCATWCRTTCCRCCA